MAALGDRESRPEPRFDAASGEWVLADPVRDLAHYLEGEFRDGRPYAPTGRRPDRTGRQLTDRMVSRLEVENAMRFLPYRQRRLIALRYGEGLSVVEVCRILGCSPQTYARERLAAIEAMVLAIYEWG